jgi:hypothetical protein
MGQPLNKCDGYTWETTGLKPGILGAGFDTRSHRINPTVEREPSAALKVTFSEQVLDRIWL